MEEQRRRLFMERRITQRTVSIEPMRAVLGLQDKVDRVLEKRLKDGFLEYKILWRGCSPFEAKWDRETNLSCIRKILSFEQTRLKELLCKRCHQKLRTIELAEDFQLLHTKEQVQRELPSVNSGNGRRLSWRHNKNALEQYRHQNQDFPPTSQSMIQTKSKCQFSNIRSVENIESAGEAIRAGAQISWQRLSVRLFAQQLTGAAIELLPEVASITLTKGTLFDVMQSVWSFSVLVFSVLALKLTKYINFKHKEQRVIAQRAQFRDSICITLSRIDGLLRGRHRAELQTLKYYAKETLAI